MNNLTKYAIAILASSTLAMLWGFEYRSDHRLDATAAFFGATASPTYTLAGWAAGLGVLAFIIGIALLIGGLVQQKQPGTDRE